MQSSNISKLTKRANRYGGTDGRANPHYKNASIIKIEGRLKVGISIICLEISICPQCIQSVFMFLLQKERNVM